MISVHMLQISNIKKHTALKNCIIRKNTFYPPCNLIESEPGATSAVLNPAINTREYIERMYANFSVGLKFTVLFEIASDGKCLICKDRKREVFEW